MTLSVQAAQAALVQRLQAAGIDNPPRLAAQALAHVLQTTRLDVLVNPARLLTAAESTALQAVTARLEAHEPFERITGGREFYGLPFGLNNATLAPRPETELLVEAALALQPKHILDVGTGSGCIVLSLLKHLPQATAVATDLSSDALQQAAANAVALHVKDRIEFIHGNYADDVRGTFDVIVSNPPYIPTAVIPTLDANVRNYDPHLALDGGADGLTAYRHMLAQLAPRLKPGGQLLLEIGLGQEVPVLAIAHQHGWQALPPLTDFAGIIRVLRFFRG